MSWQVLFYKEGGTEPAMDFLLYELTNTERSRFIKRVQYIQARGLDLVRDRPDILESVKGEDNLYSLRLPGSQNNPRFLLCVDIGQTFYVLHGFKEKNTRDYTRAISVAKQRRDALKNA